jgi:hypothetical protein
MFNEFDDDNGVWADEEPYISETDERQWEDRDSNVVPIEDLDTRHLQAIVAGLKKGVGYWGQKWKLPDLEAELANRKHGRSAYNAKSN